MAKKQTLSLCLKGQYKLCIFIAFNKLTTEEFCTSFITFYLTLDICILQVDKNTTNYQDFLKKFHEDSNKSYPSMVVNPQILDYSMIMHQIIHCFETDTSWILNLIFKLLFLK